MSGVAAPEHLRLERREQQDATPTFGGGLVMMTPAIDEDYWSYRVRLTDDQSVVGFPKFGTIGIGFSQEEDWNTNLPYTCGTVEIREHIWHNRGDKAIKKRHVDQAIALIQEAAHADRGTA